MHRVTYIALPDSTFRIDTSPKSVILRTTYLKHHSRVLVGGSDLSKDRVNSRDEYQQS